MTAHYIALITATSTTKAKSSSSIVLVYELVIFAVLFIVYRRWISKKRAGGAAGGPRGQVHQQIEVGDEVLTGAGIFGIVEEILDDRVVLSTGDQSTVTVLRSTIARRTAAAADTLGPDGALGFDSADHPATDFDSHDETPGDSSGAGDPKEDHEAGEADEAGPTEPGDTGSGRND